MRGVLQPIFWALKDTFLQKLTTNSIGTRNGNRNSGNATIPALFREYSLNFFGNAEGVVSFVSEGC
jgi:hypothetical protein